MRRVARIALVLVLVPGLAQAAKEKAAKDKGGEDKAEKKTGGMTEETWSGLELRSLGPAVTSGRLADIAVDPRDPRRWFVASASGGVWRTENAGTTWTPVFDGEGSYSIGCVTIDPNNSSVVWVGTGENNSQRSVSYGDGVYKSEDGGASWTNMGLKASEHIGRIVVDPRDSKTVYVAAQGPLWAPGGDRGLYKTTDGGKTWKAVLTISENTGVNEVVMDPRDPDLLYASAYQRRRHVWTLIDGGPESAVYRSTDAGATWQKLEKGLPKEDMGRIGLAISPADPDVVYAIIEARDKKAKGLYRSTDRGASWEKRGDYVSGSPQYYNEIVADPKERDRVYAMDTWLHVSDDGGKTFRKLGETWKHVDNHFIWIDPADTRHYLVGCDGGLYESFDRGASWLFKANLPVTQFYRLAVDDDWPAYHVYGGTQDNFTLGGPARTLNVQGITNADWFVTVGGDGFQSQVDPKDPAIVYSESQYGGLVRFDRKSGEALYIQPQPGKDEPPLRWNWDSPLIISPHDHKRLYFAAQRIFRSDDRGDTWTPISPDLTRQIDRNVLPVMGRVWGPDAVAKSDSTSFYGNIVSLSESPLVAGLLYAGTDDGLVQVTEDGGKTWRKVEKFPGVPDRSYVGRLVASGHDADTVYAGIDNHKNGDFRPYLLRSGDRGRTWTQVAGDLPQRGSVYALAEDPVDEGLLFAGTEFGLFFTRDGGGHWIRLKGGLPTVAVRDIVVQKRENDLVIATFGRGFYVLDDLTPLRVATAASLEQAAQLFPVKKALAYMPASPLGLKGKSFQGGAFFTAPNPPFGAVFTYYLKDGLKTLKEQRQEHEKEDLKKKQSARYPTPDELRAEALEEAPAVILTVKDADGHVVREVTGPVKAGVHRVSWDLRFPPSDPTSLEPPKEDDPFEEPPTGPMALPGSYTVSLSQRVRGEITSLAGPVAFEVEPLGAASLPAQDRAALLAFERKVARLQRAVLGAQKAGEDAGKRLEYIRRALDDTAGADPALGRQARSLEARLEELMRALEGDEVMAKHNEPTAPSIVDRVQTIVATQWTTTSAPTRTSEDAYAIAAEAFARVLEQLRTLVDVDLRGLDASLEAAGAPWTPGRVPAWKPE